MLAVAILAAGESRRMGTPKALLDYHGKTFVEHLVEVTQHPQVGLLRIVLGAKAEEIRARIHVPAESIVLNQDWPKGQLSSIQAAIRSLGEQSTDGLMLCPVDHPVISREVVAQMIEAFYGSEKQIVVPTYEGRRGHPVIFRADLYSELLAASPDVGARQVVWAHTSDVLEIPTKEEGVVLNLDDPAAYHSAMQRK
jgi:CTP:molybdopterin cytidylyltransferase MocA